MDIGNFRIAMEKPIYESFAVLFRKADLTDEEKEIFIKNKKYCQYWLLRSKHFYSQSFDPNIPNFIKRLARVLIKLFSENVSGRKMNLLREMFPRKMLVHKIYPTRSGLRCTQNSTKIENTYFELEIMSFFIDNNFKIELSRNQIKGKKIPEFVAIDEGVRICIEAKQLNVEKIMDNIFGDHFIIGIDGRLSPEERDHGYQRIKNQIEENYENAMRKFQHIQNNDLFLLFISTGYKINYMGEYCRQFLSNLPGTWISDEFSNFIGLVLIEPEKTTFYQNKSCDSEIHCRLNEMGINNYHRYIPE